MNLAIAIIDRKIIKAKSKLYVTAAININDFCESFDMPLEWWSIEDYERQWKEGLERIKTYDVSCLVARIYDLNKNPCIDWWLLYKEGSKIIIRNEIIFTEYYEEFIGNNLFTVETCYNFIRKNRPALSPSGLEISEWTVTL